MSLPAAAADAPLVDFGTVDSTQNVIRRALAETPALAAGWTATAAHQTAGRGRLGRAWQDGGDSLMWSTWLPAPLPPERMPMVSLVAGLALVEALAPMVDARLKWPNDVLDPDLGKLAGILVEGAGGEPAPGRLIPRGAIVGIGLNLAWPAAGRPSDLPHAAALAAWHVPTAAERAAIVPAWRRRAVHWLVRLAAGEGAPFAAAYGRILLSRQRLVRLQTVESADTVGYIEGIDEQGNLLLRRADDDALVRTSVGELVLVDQPVPQPE